MGVWVSTNVWMGLCVFVTKSDNLITHMLLIIVIVSRFITLF